MVEVAASGAVACEKLVVEEVLPGYRPLAGQESTVRKRVSIFSSIRLLFTMVWDNCTLLVQGHATASEVSSIRYAQNLLAIFRLALDISLYTRIHVTSPS